MLEAWIYRLLFLVALLMLAIAAVSSVDWLQLWLNEKQVTMVTSLVLVTFGFALGEFKYVRDRTAHNSQKKLEVAPLLVEASIALGVASALSQTREEQEICLDDKKKHEALLGDALGKLHEIRADHVRGFPRAHLDLSVLEGKLTTLKASLNAGLTRDEYSDALLGLQSDFRSLDEAIMRHRS
ncbi:hypothetical protein [Mesobacterium pallidum]|uniref:hypothetical protein n=1 Tax=Mesobacterium pallidum TaxID=2872037 RepID=UPI001EE2F994|nr:hypothetical protein [Mesobacterium pallidum]